MVHVDALTSYHGPHRACVPVHVCTCMCVRVPSMRVSCVCACVCTCVPTLCRWSTSTWCTSSSLLLPTAPVSRSSTTRQSFRKAHTTHRPTAATFRMPPLSCTPASHRSFREPGGRYHRCWDGPTLACLPGLQWISKISRGARLIIISIFSPQMSGLS